MKAPVAAILQENNMQIDFCPDGGYGVAETRDYHPSFNTARSSYEPIFHYSAEERYELCGPVKYWVNEADKAMMGGNMRLAAECTARSERWKKYEQEVAKGLHGKVEPTLTPALTPPASFSKPNREGLLQTVVDRLKAFVI